MGKEGGQGMALLIRKIWQIEPPISQEGIAVREVKSKGSSGGVKATDFLPGQRPENFTPSTVILHDDHDGSHGIWDLLVPEPVLKYLVDMTLRIESVRTHAMLHTPPYDRETDKRRYARISMNGELTDKILIIKPHPHGEDFGVDSRRPIPVYRFVDRTKSIQEIKIEVDEKVYWDIDRIILEPITLREELTPEARMVAGALLSAFAGGVMGLLAF
ncbi:MAG: hypothetical protein IH856_23830 [Deltaproteobacteria bacterium]|nr:hypothetical protein [Deltaproteobacteria bacterium]